MIHYYKTTLTAFSYILIKMADQPNMNWKWSCRLKHPQIEIQKLIALRACSSRDYWAVCVAINKQIDMSSTKNVWYFRGVNGKGARYVGICLASRISGLKFEKQVWVELGHGHYMFSSLFAYSHREEKVNNKPTSLEFRSKDLLRLQFTPRQGVLSISKQNSDSKFSINVLAAPEGDFYVPCAYLLNIGDAVQVINK